VRKIFQTAGPLLCIQLPVREPGKRPCQYASAGDRVLLFETGHFSNLWRQIAEKFGLKVDYVPGNWRKGASADELAARLADDKDHSIKAVMVVHNETSTGVTSRIPNFAGP